MISRLRRRLTLLMTAMTALVLAGALLVTWRLSEEQYRRSAEQLFENNFSSLCDRLADADSVSDVWLAEQEQGTECLLFLKDNGASLHYEGSLASRTPRSELEALVLEAVGQLLDTSRRDSAGAVFRQEAHGTMAGNASDSYFMALALLPRGETGAYLMVASLQDKGFLARHEVLSALQYAGLWVAGSALLALISFWLTGKALAPTALAMRRQKEFIAAASHELRSPLAVIKTSLQVVDGDLSPERQTVLLHNSQKEADRMSRLIDDLLLLANGDLGNLPAHLEPLAPDNLCIEVYDQFYLVARDQGHVLTLALPEEAVPTIRADEGRLRQLLAILLNNAIEHTPAETPIELVLRAEGKNSGVTISVVDHGLGIPDEAKPHLFDRFYRADASRTNKHNFGLGLSVAKELARLHGASLTATDTPGGGATFILAFNPKSPK